MGRLKGIQLSINMLVIIAIVVIVLSTLIAFFVSSTGEQIDRGSTEQVFFSICQTICKPVARDNYLTAGSLEDSNSAFLDACVALGHGSYEFPNQCLERCGCNMEVDFEAANGDLDVLIDQANQNAEIPSP